MKTLQVFNFRNLYGSGLTESVPSLCRGLVKAGIEVEACAPRARPEWMAESFHMNVHAVVTGFSSLGWSPTMHTAVSHLAKGCDLVHCHEMWTLPGRYASQAARAAQIPCIISPRGTFSSAARRFSGWKKRLMWRWLRKSDVMSASCLHATAEHEREDIRSMGYRGPVAVIPNAVPIPKQRKAQGGSGLRRLVYLGRIHPIKGVAMLVELWGQLSREFPEWELDIAGVDDGGYVAKLKAQARQLGLERLRFSGPQFGLDKIEFLDSADLYCLPTTSDNFAITVGEALAHGVPVVTTTAAPWGGLSERKCGWWVHPRKADLAMALREAMGASFGFRKDMGARGKKWVVADFGEESICIKMKQTYEWLVGRGSVPTWVEDGGA